MKSFRLRPVAAGAALLVAAQLASAITLGRAQGVALVGRALDVGIAFTPDAGSDPGEVCADAEVFYGDNRVDASRVTTRVEAGTVRVRAAAPLDEPVVTVYLRVGCNNRLTRRYVLLAEQPQEVADTVARSQAIAAAVPARPAPAAVASAPVAAAVRGASAPTGRLAAGSSAAVAPRAVRPAREASVVRKPAAPVAAQARPRLQLEPLDLTLEVEPRLKLSAALGAVQPVTAQQRADAAARWNALNAQPEDLLRSTQRVQGLETDVKALREAMLKNEASLVQVRGRLEQAERARYANALVYGLLAALLAACVLAAYLWRRRADGSGMQWGRSGTQALETGFGLDSLPATGSAPMAGGPAMVPAAAPARRAASVAGSEPPVDFDLSFTESGLDRLDSRPVPLVAAAERPQRSELSEWPGSIRAVAAEELGDIQQQVDFFSSLGEYGKAVAVLRNHVQTHPEASAVAWLDLLEIHHKLQQQDAYEQVRAEFQQAFKAQVPAFGAWTEGALGLEAYPQALARIQALWPSPKVLDVIEESIFRTPGDTPGEPFGLEAYRDLLLLHAMATELMVGDDRTEAGHEGDASGFSHTQIQPLSTHPAWAGSGLGGLSLELPSFVLTAPDLRQGLDINLDELPAQPPQAALPHLLDFDLGEEYSFELKPKKA